MAKWQNDVLVLGLTDHVNKLGQRCQTLVQHAIESISETVKKSKKTSSYLKP